MRYAKISLLLCIVLLMSTTTGCAQNRNMTRNDIVEDEWPGGGEESFDFAADTGDFNPDDLGAETDLGSSSVKGVSGDFEQKGNASWYGRAFHGRQTASGEEFDMYELTAAHKEYPFGTILEVTNLDNGQKARVRVNDRGPYAEGRILDVSYAAGRDLGMLATGTANVGIKVISEGDGSRGASTVATGGYGTVHDPYDTGQEMQHGSGAYMVQCGAFYSKNNADNLRDRVDTVFSNRVVVVQEDGMYKVRIMDIPSKQEAERFKQILSQQQIPGYIIQR